MKLRAVLVLAVFGAITAQADPLSAYEGFEYTAGANLGTENGGTEVESPLASCIVIPPSGSRATRTMIQPRARPTCRGVGEFLP
jgi:hypothetical protein